MPAGYDPVTLNHWLWYKYLCHECSPADFQRLFENIIRRANPEFIQIRPYGQLGDRKCDGLFLTDSTVFQVYSPDDIKLYALKTKINEDLEGAVKHWGNGLKKWVFVFNARRGLPADIPMLLMEKKKQYPSLLIDSISNDQLWEMARGLSLQQRTEVLGAPAGYEDIFSVLPLETSSSVKHQSSWLVIVQDILTPINTNAVIEAIHPDNAFGPPLCISPSIENIGWSSAFSLQTKAVEEAIDRGRTIVPRYAIFSLAPIPLAIHLGFLLSDRVELQCYQFHRDSATWKWPSIEETPFNSDLSFTGVPDSLILEPVEVVIRVSLSDTIHAFQTLEVVSSPTVQIELSCSAPSVYWLHRHEQLSDLAATFQKILEIIRKFVPKCQGIHLFYAGPTGGCVVIGQRINPRMNPPVHIYEYSRQKSPSYEKVITLTANGYAQNNGGNA